MHIIRPAGSLPAAVLSFPLIKKCNDSINQTWLILHNTWPHKCTCHSPISIWIMHWWRNYVVLWCFCISWKLTQKYKIGQKNKSTVMQWFCSLTPRKFWDWTWRLTGSFLSLFACVGLLCLFSTISVWVSSGFPPTVQCRDMQIRSTW